MPGDSFTRVGIRAATSATAVADSLALLAAHGASELPADRGLTSQVQDVADRYRQAAADVEAATAKMRECQNEAEALRGSFEQRHETDLARLNGERAQRHIERKADVGTAEV